MRIAINHNDFNNMERIDQIIATAVQVFEKRGYGGFSVRQVAREAGISLGHLQHFFKTKSDLLAAIFDHVNQRYEETHTGILKALPNAPDERLRQYLDFLMRDNRNTSTNHFFFDFWALASRDPEAAAVMDTMYTAHVERIEKLVTDARPDLRQNQRKLLSAQIVAQLEGMMVLVHHKMPYHSELADLDREVVSNLMNLVMKCPAGV